MQPPGDRAHASHAWHAWQDPSVAGAWFVLALLLAVGLAYLPAFGAGFVWDDDLHLLDNAVLQENGLYRVWVLREEWIYYPVTFTSYWLEHRLFGLAPAGYHATNVALHAVSALLFWRVLLLLRLPGAVAMVAAMLFALHPQNVESVAWITQRKNTLSMAFFLLSIHAWLRFDAARDGPAGARRGHRWYAWSFLAFALGMLSKGSIVGLPFVLLLALAWRRGVGLPRGADAPRDAPWRRPIERGELLALAAFLLPALAFPLHDIAREEVWLSGDVVRDDSFWARLAGAGWNAWFYVWKTVVPTDLSFVYPRWEIDPGRVAAWFPTAAALLALAGALLLWRRGGATAGAARATSFVLVYYALMIAPALGFVDFYYLRYSYVADHYQYYAQLGVVVLLTGAAARIPRLLSGIPPRIWPRIGWGVSFSLCLALGLASYRQCLAYESEETLWRDTLAKNPDASLALNGLGGILGARGEYREALPLLLRATHSDPRNREAWVNLGMVQEVLGRPEQALTSFRQAVRHWPGRGGLSEEEVSRLSLAEVHLQLGLLRSHVGAIGGAEYHYRQAAALDPGSASARIGIGNSLLLRGALPAAVASYRQALSLAPEAVPALEMLTRIHATAPGRALRDVATAVALGERAARVTGRGDASVLDALAAAYAQAGRFDAALAAAGEALALARHAGRTELAERIEASLRRYRRGEPPDAPSIQVRPPRATSRVTAPARDGERLGGTLGGTERGGAPRLLVYGGDRCGQA